MSDPTEAFNDRLAEAGYPYKVAIVDIGLIDLLEKNARFMKNETFQRLVENVRGDGHLSSVPFCWLQPSGRYLVLSGNHRVQAAKAAGHSEVLVMYTEEDLTHSEQIAIQLSHNSLVGEDDPAILRELWEEIDEVNLKLYAGLSDNELATMDPVNLSALSDAPLDFKTVTFFALPPEVERLERVFPEALRQAKHADYAAVVQLADMSRWLDAQDAVGEAYDIRNNVVALTVVLDIFERHMADLAAGFQGKDDTARHAKWVPFTSIVGTANIPADAAVIVRRAIDKMKADGEIEDTSLWRGIEYMAANYLAGE